MIGPSSSQTIANGGSNKGGADCATADFVNMSISREN
jgi:hypothetical protein